MRSWRLCGSYDKGDSFAAAGDAEDHFKEGEKKTSMQVFEAALKKDETANELAVSDSWGKRFELRWIHLDEADAVTLGKGFVINL